MLNILLEVGGLICLLNPWFMTSVMQCRNSVTTLRNYFTEAIFCKDFCPGNQHDRTFTREVVATLELINREESCLVSLHDTEAVVDKFH